LLAEHFPLELNMRPTSTFQALALSLGLCFAATVSAQTGTTNSNGVQASGGKAPSFTSNSGLTTQQSHPAPGGGPAFGQHVSGMAPDHPKEHGRLFGECVSAMAQGAECDHHEMISE
jgi:hypothetical protein